MALYVMKRYSGLSNREVAKQFGGLHYSAVTKTCTRLEIEMRGDKKLRKVKLPALQRGASVAKPSETPPKPPAVATL